MVGIQLELWFVRYNRVFLIH